MPNVSAAQPNIGGALYENFVIPFLVLRRKVCMTPTAPVPFSNAANNEDFDTKWILHWAKFRQGARDPKRYI